MREVLFFPLYPIPLGGAPFVFMHPRATFMYTQNSFSFKACYYIKSSLK